MRIISHIPKVMRIFSGMSNRLWTAKMPVQSNGGKSLTVYLPSAASLKAMSTSGPTNTACEEQELIENKVRKKKALQN